MQIPYRHSEKIKINQHPKHASRKQLDGQQLVIVLVPDPPRKATWDALAYGEVLRSRYQRGLRRDKSCRMVTLDLPNKTGTRILLQAVKADDSTFACQPSLACLWSYRWLHH